MEGDKLIEPKLIIEIPGSKSNSTSFIHVGGAIVIGLDRNLYLTTGDGKACFDYGVCQKIIKEGPLRAETVECKLLQTENCIRLEISLWLKVLHIDRRPN